MPKREFTPDEINRIKSGCRSKTVEELAREVKCGHRTMKNLLNSLGLKAYRRQEPWTEYDDSQLRILAPKYSYEDTAARMNKPESTVIEHARMLGLEFYKTKTPWTLEQEDVLKRGWGRRPLSSLVKELRRTETAVIRRARELNLGPAYAASEDIPLKQFCDETGISFYRVTRTLAIKHDFPIKSQKPGKRRMFYYVDSEKILAWMKKHQPLYDGSLIPLYYFGEEPEWLVQKRKADRDDKSGIASKSADSRWSEYESSKARDLLRIGMTYSQISESLGTKTPEQVRRKLNRMGESYKLARFWRGPEFKFVRENYKTMTDAELGAKLGRSEAAVRKQRWQAGLIKKGERDGDQTAV